MDASQPNATRKCPFCAEEIQADALKCRFCSQWLVPIPGAPMGGAPPGLVPSTLDGFQLLAVYQESFDLGRIPAAQQQQFAKHQLVESFSVGGAIALHYVTIGIFTILYYGLRHSKLPRIRPDDFGGGKAIGFLFIPFFNFYWLFPFWLRLADRVNFQFRLRNQPPPVSRGLVLAATIIQVIPYVGFFWWLVFGPIVIGQLQGALNALARAQAAGTPGA
ncbi:MAG: hypothetical protein FJW23_16520 [Acidimicrobiia bacterium]|nr:hypothetical protein [Acidimicrobiia bacterium]